MNNHLKFYAVFFLTLSCIFKIHAQFYNYGQDPAGIRWTQIETKNFRFIFPSNDTVLARKAANDFEKSYQKVGNSLYTRPKKMPVILHTQSVISNGFVVWAPKRAELYPNLSQSDISQDNMEQLALHEDRHIVQMSKLNQGMGKVLYYLLGEESVGALTGLFIPLWFLEGDAVCSETALSESGRGRTPYFTNKMKALLLEKGKYPYNKAVFGSYKDFVPDHYELGYLITAQARKVYGKNIWSDVLNNVARRPYTLTPFSNGIKKVTGLNKRGLYKATLDSLTKEWQQENLQIKPSYYKCLTKKNRFYSVYSCPASFEDSLIIACKSNMNEAEKIVLINKNGLEKKVLYTGYIDPASITYSGQQISFIEYMNDIRWQNRSYDNITTYNVKTKKFKKLTTGTRYQTCCLSPDGQKIAAVYNSEKGITGMHIIDAIDGKIISEINNPDNLFIINPTWSDDGRLITCVLHNEKGKALGIIDVTGKIIKILTSFSFVEYSYPEFYRNYILFTSNINGTDNIYATDTLSKHFFQLTSSLYGANEVKRYKKNGIIYTNLTVQGNEIVFTPWDSLLWKPVENISYKENALSRNLSLQENGIVDFTHMPDIIYKLKNYHKGCHLFNFHSWAPVYLNVDQNTIDPGAVLFSQNLLSTATTSLGYKYNTLEKTGKYILGFDYAGFFPILTSTLSYGNRRYNISNSEKTVIAEETIISDGIRVPFTFSHNRYVRQLQFTVSSNLTYAYPKADTLKKRVINSLDYGFYFYNYIKSLSQDIYPPWAQTLTLRYAHTPFSGDKLGTIAGGNMNLYFPGILRHNSLFISTVYQKRDAGLYAFSYFYTLPRGFNDWADNFQSMVKISGNYALPLLYPDLSVSSILYMKRIRALLFYDYCLTYNKNQLLRSYGVELLTDVHILRFIAPIALGARFIRNQNANKLSVEPLFSINFNAL